MTLDEHLGRLYRANVLKLDSPAAAMAQFKQELGCGTLLIADARARVAALAGIDDARCFISKMHREFLTAALSGL